MWRSFRVCLLVPDFIQLNDLIHIRISTIRRFSKVSWGLWLEMQVWNNGALTPGIMWVEKNTPITEEVIRYKSIYQVNFSRVYNDGYSLGVIKGNQIQFHFLNWCFFRTTMMIWFTPWHLTCWIGRMTLGTNQYLCSMHFLKKKRTLFWGVCKRSAA